MTRDEITTKIGSNIKKQRLQQDLSQEALSLSADINQGYIGRLERGEKCPTIDTLYKISRALNISVCDLLVFDDCDYPDTEIIRRIEKALEKVPDDKKMSIVKIVEDIAEAMK